MRSKPAQIQRLLWLYHSFHSSADGAISAAVLEARYSEWQLDRKTAIRDRKQLETWAGIESFQYDPAARVWKLTRRFDLPEELRDLRRGPERQERLQSVAREVLRSTQGPRSLVAGVLDGAALDGESPHVSVFAPPRLGRDSARVSEFWLQLHEAITARRRLVLSRGGKDPVRVDPLHLWWAQGGWYLLVRDSDDERLRSHAVARLDDVTESVVRGRTKGRPDVYPASDFDAKEWLGNGDWLYRGGKKTTARIRFDTNAVSAFRDRIWQSDIVWIDQPDGSAVLLHPYPARAHGEWEMARRILGWGEYCVVEEPVSLRARIAKLLEDLVKRYS